MSSLAPLQTSRVAFRCSVRARLVAASLAAASVLACGPSGRTASPLSPTPVGHSAVQVSSRTIANPFAGPRDALASCLGGSRDTSCFTAASEVTASAPAASPFADCLRGEGGAGCFAGPRLNGRAGTSIVAPVAPSNLSGSISGNVVTLTWLAPLSPETDQATSFVVEAGSASGLANLASVATIGSATSYSAGGVPVGTYFVRVRAVNGGGVSPPSNEIVVQVGVGGPPPNCGPLGTPTLTLTTNSGGTVGFSWTIPSGGPTAYILQAGSAPGLSNLANLDLRQSSPTFTTSGVPPGIYYVRVLARRNNCAVSAPSNEVIVTVTVGPPMPAGSITRFETGYGDALNGGSWCPITGGTPFTITVDGTQQGSLSCRTGSILDFSVSPGAHVYERCVNFAGRPSCSNGSFTIAPDELKVIAFHCNFC